jgi:hypothetical protein
VRRLLRKRAKRHGEPERKSCARKEVIATEPVHTAHPHNPALLAAYIHTSDAPILAFGSVLKLNAIHLLSNKAVPDFTLVSDDFDALSLRCNARRAYEKAKSSSVMIASRSSGRGPQQSGNRADGFSGMISWRVK